MAEEKDIHFMSEDELKQHWREYADLHEDEFLNPIFSGVRQKKNKWAILTAGAPGSGKSEVINSIYGPLMQDFVHIDADDFRKLFPKYNGANASDYQKGATKLVDRAFRRALNESQSFILEGTFNSQSSASNIKRALNHDYSVRIVYTYLEPEIDWRFVVQRAIKTGRQVPKSAFVNGFLNIPQNIAQILSKYGDRIEIEMYAGLGHQQHIYRGVEAVIEHLPNDISRDRLEAIVNGN
ncbi:zeta toxin family protein [Furfurilactobacillus rossiae]|uniref:zeta toxin family protein n=1 Tax=Furfurilactobacillus rossiae TaxID=231049 RepID=UPI0015B91F04|nr:zeta toxin family protein [Furfurilactobacillus rossiae]MCF6166113.1 zeta toxin family protein [Furfurilactobacillus rossiae]